MVEHVNGTNRAYSGDSIKHIFLNNERLVSKVCTNNLHGSTQTYLDYEQMHTYYWHSDHLGSATLITDYQGKEYERIEYTPYGELWIDQNQAYVDGYLPYRFTGKELDEETGLYYYGQRYLDPQYNIWMTSDPAIYDYMSQSKNGEGGIYNITNLNLYHYAGNNPIKYVDPNGRSADLEDMNGGVNEFPEGMLEQILEAWNEALANITDLSNQLGEYLNSGKALSDLIISSASTWLGIDLSSDEAVSAFKNDVDTLLAGIESHNLFIYDPDYTSRPDKDPTTIAYVHTTGRKKNDRTIYFTENYDSRYLRDRGNYTYSGIIVHEVSHKVLDTKDKTFRVEEMRDLSNELKYINANNWMYFYERVYKGGRI